MKRGLRILLVEDSESDVRLLEETLRDTGLNWELIVASDGEYATQLLRASPGTPAPDLILLDLNLPRKGGHDLLRELKDDSHLRTIPVIVFSSSRSAADIDAAYAQFANCYIVKPKELGQYEDVVRNIEEFWRQHAQLPPRPRLS